MARPKGSKNYIPGQAEKIRWLKFLCERARAGDTNAIGFLLILAELRESKNKGLNYE